MVGWKTDSVEHDIDGNIILKNSDFFIRMGISESVILPIEQSFIIMKEK
jgi:hypothetical protein